MLNADLNKVLKGKTSRYSLVIATAKRARIIAEEGNYRRKTCNISS